MVLSFIILWTPLQIINTYRLIFNTELFKSKYSVYLFFISHTLALSHSIFNPFIYARNHRNLRKGLLFYLRFKFIQRSYADEITRNEAILLCDKLANFTPGYFPSRRRNELCNSRLQNKSLSV
jgi:hypothetical protein